MGMDTTYFSADDADLSAVANNPDWSAVPCVDTSFVFVLTDEGRLSTLAAEDYMAEAPTGPVATSDDGMTLIYEVDTDTLNTLINADSTALDAQADDNDVPADELHALAQLARNTATTDASLYCYILV